VHPVESDATAAQRSSHWGLSKRLGPREQLGQPRPPVAPIERRAVHESTLAPRLEDERRLGERRAPVRCVGRGIGRRIGA
jgi:hypothetical protein